MQSTDRARFAELIAGVMAYHRQPISDAIMGVWWRGCQRWSLEQVVRAIDSLTQDAEAGKYPPKIGDVTRVLEGTTTDRAHLAWGKVLEAMGSVGAYTDVVFDDPAIHAVIQDMGGWPKMCRGELKDLGYVQHRFCVAHQAYTHSQHFEFPRLLAGDRSSDAEYEKKGLALPKPALVGDAERCQEVYQGGASGGKTAITFASIADLVNDGPRLLESTH